MTDNPMTEDLLTKTPMDEDLLTKTPMDEDLLSKKNPLEEDLLTKIHRETHERLRELRGAVDEYDRLQDDLSELDAAPGPPADLAGDPELPVDPELPIEPELAGDPELPVDPEPAVAPQAVPEPPVASPSVAAEPPANVVRLADRSRLSRTRMVSPKIARLMRAPRRPALERDGVVRVGAGRQNPPTDEPVEEIDAHAALYERSL